MKRFFFAFAIFITIQLNAQNYLIRFEGEGKSSTVSAVKVENLNAGTSLTLDGSDILSLTFTDGIYPTPENQSGMKIYPNPMIDNSTLVLFPPSAGDAEITIYDITGRPIARLNTELETLQQDFRLSGLRKGLYFISVTGHNFRLSGKLVSNGGSGMTAGIEKTGGNYLVTDEKQAKNSIKGVQNTIEMDYSQGEMLRYTGFSGDLKSVVTDIATSDKVVKFLFKGIPDIITSTTSSTSSTTATSGGSVTSDGGYPVEDRGVCWNTTGGPSVILNTKTSDGSGTGDFISSITGLTAGMTYYVRAYATNSEGTAYGDELKFSTTPVKAPALTTTAVSSITSSSAVSGGNITDNGGGSITARGICWSASPSPTVSDNITSDGTGEGSFTGEITGLQPYTVYHVRAYATNSAGTAYGNDRTFTTMPVVPSVTTVAASAITRTAATSGGNIDSNGGSAVTTSGICWSTSHNPATEGSHTDDGTSTGSFTGRMTGLSPNTLYYVRAYATNSEGTAYGDELEFTTTPVQAPALTTTAVTSITSSSAVSGGNITDNGGGSITARGICWSASPSPTVSDNITSDGTGEGSFTGEITGLQPYTVYHVRAYATNCAGTVYGNDRTFTTLPVVPSVTTVAASAITRTTATSGGNIGSNGGSAVTTSGICWSTSHNPATEGSHTDDGTATGSFTGRMTGLSPNTLYYVRAYATNSEGTAYGDELEFTTAPVQAPALTTTAVTSITSSSAVSGGNITDNGGGSITARGICWSASPSPTVSDNITSDGTGEGRFASEITGLQPYTVYHVRAYATNGAGTAYGNDRTFTTLPVVPSVTTVAASAITRTTATSGGNIGSNGGSAVTTSGICWSTSHNPATEGSHTDDGTATGSFTGRMTGLSPNTLYYTRAYASNSVGTSYGDELSFTTDPAILPTLSTAAVTSVGPITAVSGGNITDDGDGAITARGICWSASTAPTISNNRTTDGTGTGSFTSRMTGLSPNTLYYIRAYATNSEGTAYGNELEFTTAPVQAPTLTTTAVTSITSSSAVSGGNITDNGGGSITARGICWSASPSPTVSDNITSDGTGEGRFASEITGLQPYTVYHVRAYATNSIGTAYGEELTFTSLSLVPTVITLEATSITENTAKTGGNVTANGGPGIIARGVCWGTSASPSVTGLHTSDGTGDGEFTSNLSGLAPNTVYYVRAYASSEEGTTYGEEVTFMYLIPEINAGKWLNDASCFLNLSFDDTQSAHLALANLLSEYNFNGTFYAQTNDFDDDPSFIENYKNILLSGHEVGSHTVSHSDLTTLSDEEIIVELDSSVNRLNRYLDTNCTSFAHPFDNSNDHINNIIFSKNLFTRNYSEYFSSERPRFCLSSEAQINDVTDFIDEQIASNNSCLIAGHGIDGRGYSPNTTEFFVELLNYIKGVQNTKNVWVTTMSNGALYESLFYEVSISSQVDQSDRKIDIRFSLPDKAVYDNFNKLLFTFKISKSSSWAIQNTDIEYTESDTHYIYTIDLKEKRELTLHYKINK